MDSSVNREQLIPVQTLEADSASLASPMLRSNPMIWEGEAQADGVFVGLSNDADPLAILSAAPVALPTVPRLPEDFVASARLRVWFETLRNGLERQIAGTSGGSERFDLNGLNAVDQQAVREVLGEGEVSGSVTLDGVDLTLEEALLPGVWRVTGGGAEWVEVGSVPEAVIIAADSLEPAPFAVPAGTDDAAVAAWGPSIMNAPAVLHEVSERAAACAAEPSVDGALNHVINFTLLPMSDSDERMLLDVLGRAALSLRSGGFGDCRVMATRYRHVWAVQFVNAMGNPVLDTLEIGAVPQSICAQQTDFEDALERLDDLLEAYLQ
ncbi:MAG: hydrogenase expression/formation protein [Pseudomonadota bacterium]